MGHKRSSDTSNIPWNKPANVGAKSQFSLVPYVFHLCFPGMNFMEIHLYIVGARFVDLYNKGLLHASTETAVYFCKIPELLMPRREMAPQCRNSSNKRCSLWAIFVVLRDGSLIRCNPKNFEISLRRCFRRGLFSDFCLCWWDSIFRVIGKATFASTLVPASTLVAKGLPKKRHFFFFGKIAPPTTPQCPKGKSSSFVHLVP